ncbi:hypothetical protein T484DRAFT_1863944 [Baffinella frigidus]|nr:hypothetical protein T484DRAFT_1863944 [Cryptophyta sp. CCMP2293]
MPRDGELISAARDGKLEEVRTLIRAGADINEKDSVSDGAGTRVAAGFQCARWECLA